MTSLAIIIITNSSFNRSVILVSDQFLFIFSWQRRYFHVDYAGVVFTIFCLNVLQLCMSLYTVPLWITMLILLYKRCRGKTKMLIYLKGIDILTGKLMKDVWVKINMVCVYSLQSGCLRWLLADSYRLTLSLDWTDTTPPSCVETMD